MGIVVSMASSSTSAVKAKYAATMSVYRRMRSDAGLTETPETIAAFDEAAKAATAVNSADPLAKSNLVRQMLPSPPAPFVPASQKAAYNAEVKVYV